jgi:predicted Zn finger-like uncharacterized protein
MDGYYSLEPKDNMPLITSCPECNTQFVVKKEQLKAYDGQVRCGTCQHVFNAKEYLVKQSRTKKVTPTKVEAVLSDISLNPDTQTLPTEHIEMTAPDALQAQFNQDAPIEPATQEDTTAETQAATGTAHTPSFLNDLAIDEPVAKPLRRAPFSWPLFGSSLFLLLVLLVQGIYFKRTEIAAYYPQTKPWLTQACQYAKCTIALPNNIDLLTIDDSDMQEHLTYAQVLVFTSTLINHADFPQAYPNIELTLTNVDDEPVLRRTLKPADYIHQAASTDSGIAAKEEVRIKLQLNTSDIAVAGYRVALHYP